MKEIKQKLLELQELLKKIPEECKGEANYINRRRYMEIKSSISQLVEHISE